MKIVEISEISLVCGGFGVCQCLTEEEYESGVGSHEACHQNNIAGCKDYCCERIGVDIEGYSFTTCGKKYKTKKNYCS